MLFAFCVELSFASVVEEIKTYACEKAAEAYARPAWLTSREALRVASITEPNSEKRREGIDAAIAVYQNFLDDEFLRDKKFKSDSIARGIDSRNVELYIKIQQLIGDYALGLAMKNPEYSQIRLQRELESYCKMLGSR